MSPLWTVLGWLAFALNVWGNIALTSKGAKGWIIRIACNLCWLPYSVYTSAWALFGNHLLFITINSYGWWRWRREDQHLTAAIHVPGETPPASAEEEARRKTYVLGFEDGVISAQKRCEAAAHAWGKQQVKAVSE